MTGERAVLSSRVGEAVSVDQRVMSRVMSGHAVVVTDSTAYLPADLAAEHDVRVVPCQVVMGDRSLAEGVEVTSGEVAEALRAGRSVTTSRPSVEAFVAEYRAASAGGATSIVSVHLSAELSGTVDAARSAARIVASDIPVQVVDSRSLGMGLGFAVLDAASRAAAGADAADVARVAIGRGLHASVLCYVDTLEYLRRGGRIGGAAAMLGSVLSVKPLLAVVDGRLEALDRVRTPAKALDRLAEIAVADAGSETVDVAVHHLDSPQRADVMRGLLVDGIPGLRQLVVTEIGAVVGAHVGPGLVAVVVSPVDRGF